MTYVARIRPEAERDIDDQAAYYEGEQRGLGVRFIHAVFDEIEVVTELPTKHREEFGDVRITLVTGFPFGVFFIVDADEVVVLAVQDLRRSVRRRLDEVRERLRMRDTDE